MPKVTVAGHSAHAIINDWPIALLSTSLVFDLIHLGTRKKEFADVGRYTMLGGIATAMVAAVTGIAEYFAVERTGKIKRYANVHGALNGAILGLVAGSYFLRRKKDPPVSTASILLSGVANGLTLLSAWYGDEMVYGQSVRVQEQHILPDARELRLPGDERLAETLRL